MHDAILFVPIQGPSHKWAASSEQEESVQWQQGASFCQMNFKLFLNERKEWE